MLTAGSLHTASVSLRDPTMANWEIVSFRLILFIILLPHINGVLNIDSDQEDYDTGSSSFIDIDWTAIRPHIWIPSTTNIGSHLDVRVVDGPNNATGRVEVWYKGAWGTVCDDGWDLNDANVVCRMLGFFKASSAPVRAEYGAGSGDILLDEVDCTGSEISLEDCIKSEFGVNNCDHSEDAGVICTDPISLDVRLVDGPNNNSGRVEVQENGSWGTICDDGWDAKDANVVCRMLGFFGAAYASVQATYGEGVGDISLRNVDCIGTESNLGTCFHDRPESFDCAHGEDAGAACLVLIQDDSGSGASSVDGDFGSGESSGDDDSVSSLSSWNDNSVSWASSWNDDSGSGASSGDGTMFGLQCPDLVSSTDKGLTTSSTVIISPHVHGSVDNRNFSVGCTYTSHDVFYYGDTWVACAARDDLGNYLTCDFTVTVTDGEPPHLDCPDIISTTDQGLPTSSRFPNPQASDNTDPSPSVICSRTSSDVFQFGDTNVTCHATDESGNVGRCVFVVTVQDPCMVHDPCINGECSYYIGSGQYQCDCYDQYEGTHCDVIPHPTPICKNTTWMSSRFGLISFLEGENGTWANSTEVCPFNTTNADQPIGRAICVGDLISQSTWLPDPTDNCGQFRNAGDLLGQLSKVIVSDENVAKLSEDVSLVTSNTGDISSDDIFSIANIISNISARTNSEKVTASIVAIVSNIADVDTETLESASASVIDVVKVFERQIKSVPIEDGDNFSIQQKNIAVQVQSVPTDVISNGLVISLAGDTNSDLKKFDTNIQTSNENQAEATKPDTIAIVNIPSAISSALPLISGGSSNTNGFVRVIFSVFSTPALFISKSLKNTSVGTNRSANTPVISLSIGDEKIEDLTEPINFTFTTIESGLTNPSCSYWDIGYSDWSQEGCQLLSTSGISSSNDNNWDPPPSNEKEKIVCGCNHLTNFAVLMDISREEGSFEQAYTVLTYIGCGISIVSLLVTLATYLSNRVLRGKQTNQIFICLCLTLLCLYLSFIVMMSLDSAKRQYQVKAGPCGFITALVHYFVLSSLTWMGVEGYNTYLIIVKIFDTYIPRFMLKAGGVAWGIPALIVIVTGAIAEDKYAHGDVCFLELWAQIGGLLIPMTIILLFNVVIFALIVRQLMKSSNLAGRVKKEAKVERRENIKRVQNAICILLLLGLTWITGYFLMIREFSQVVEPIFIILNSFQGLFIFLLYCVRKPMVRKQWGLTCLDRVKRQQDATTSNITHSPESRPLSTSLDAKPQEKNNETSAML
ncbi:uncharacterized protein LOC115922802 [Strongylocentrotus purpuratus]|uniref:Uncharacterized protein n=1 Tax=Strongylocentrotus purpuratus TaxID=7668 RepID=A0A7M7NLN1_STRPU|nr:uncharacterized protein LOC115922802 [Strongylocentrotus purpuratus]